MNRHEHAPQRKYFPPSAEVADLNHRRWLFFAAMTDRREESERVYASHERLAGKSPELYTRDVLRMPSSEIEALLRKERVGSPGQSAKYWPRCAETLFHEYGGDPLFMYGNTNIDDLLRIKRIRKMDPLPGFGPKILSLLSLFYEELGLMEMPSDAFPVDVHVQRFAISTGIIQCAGRVLNEHAEQVLRKLLCGLCFEEGWSSLELSHAIWFLGSRLCSSCYRNKAIPMLCPVHDQCGGSISTLKYFQKGIWDFDAQRHRKGGSLIFCLRENIDHAAIPSLFSVAGD